MIFQVTYKGYTKGIFFEYHNALEYCYTFNKNESEFVEINRIDDKEFLNLKEKIEKSTKIDTSKHMCINCARNLYNNDILICDFTHKEVNPTDYCVHYV